MIDSYSRKGTDLNAKTKLIYLYNEEKFTKRVIFKEGESTVFVLNFSKNQALPAHKHPGTNVFIQW